MKKEIYLLSVFGETEREYYAQTDVSTKLPENAIWYNTRKEALEDVKHFRAKLEKEFLNKYNKKNFQFYIGIEKIEIEEEK